LDSNPKLRGVIKGSKPEYPLNQLSKENLVSIAKGLLACKYVRNLDDISGAEWERIFANAIGAEWRPSNVGLDDIVKGNTCWGAKTVKSARPANQKTVRLISGRNSPAYSFSRTDFSRNDRQVIGAEVLKIWNTRVEEILVRFPFARTVVLLKGNDNSEFAVFEIPLERVLVDRYRWEFNKHDNLEAFDELNVHCFTWQPHGSQFTMIEKVPVGRHLISFQVPESVLVLSPEQVLEELGFDDSWVKLGN
jgi:hypothetical protein